MTRWSRIADGWAVNLDGTDAALVFSLPRVEVHSSPRGWRSACFFTDGRQSEWTLPYPGGVAATMADALAHAAALLAREAPPRALAPSQSTAPPEPAPPPLGTSPAKAVASRPH